MARTLGIPYKRSDQGSSCSPLDIRFDEELNGRTFLYRPEEYADLLGDLRSGIGIHTPIWVKAIQEEGKGTVPFLVAGQRRLLAALEYIKEAPDYLIPFKWVDPKDARAALILNIRENAGHKGLNIIDIGSNAVRLREEPTTDGGLTLDKIAEILGVSQPQVSQAIKLYEGLPERAQRAVALGKVSVDDALTILKVTDPTRRESLIEEFLTGKSKSKAPGTDASVTSAVHAVVATSDGETSSAAPANVQSTSEAGADESQPTSPPRTAREAAREAGAKISMKMPEFKKYLQVALDEDGPGSNKGEVALKKKLLEFLEGKITDPRTMDKHFNANCRMKI